VIVHAVDRLSSQNGYRSSSRRDALNLAQHLSAGTALRVNDLVPEARLSPCSTDRFDCLSGWFHPVSSPPEDQVRLSTLLIVAFAPTRGFRFGRSFRPDPSGVSYR
jgi:hypothetical protein